MNTLPRVIEGTHFHSEQILSLFRSVARSFERKGAALWPVNMFTQEWLKQQFSDNIIYCAFYKDALAGVVFLQKEDDLFWPEKPKGEAYYLHKLCVGRDYKGTGISNILMEQAVELTQNDGRKYLRLDCDPRPVLLHLYSNFGFEKVDQKTVDKMVLEHGQVIANFQLARFEMIV